MRIQVQHHGLLPSFPWSLTSIGKHFPLRIPLQARGENVAFDATLSSQATDQMRATGLNRNDFSGGLSVLGNNETLAAQMVDQVQALLLELGCIDRGHHGHCATCPLIVTSHELRSYRDPRATRSAGIEASWIPGGRSSRLPDSSR